MAQDASNVRASVDGAVYIAPSGTTLRVGGAPPETPYTEVGYISEDGVEFSETRTVEKKKAWQRNAVVRTVVTEGESTFTFAMIELTKTTAELYFGVTFDANGEAVLNPSRDYPRQVFALDVIDGDELISYDAPDAQVTEVEPISHTQDLITLGVTVTAYDNQALGGSVKVRIKSLDTTP